MAPFLLAKADGSAPDSSSSIALPEYPPPPPGSCSARHQPLVVRRLGRGRLGGGGHRKPPPSPSTKDVLDDASSVLSCSLTSVGSAATATCEETGSPVSSPPASMSPPRPSPRRRPSLPLLRRFSSCQLSPEDFQLEQMLSLLSDKEMELAAQTSYKYSCLRRGNGSSGAAGDNANVAEGPASPPPEPQSLEELRRNCAKDAARRYLRSNRERDAVAAARKLKATLQFRQEADVDGLRQAFDDPDSPYRKSLWHHLTSSPVAYVRGYDKEGRSTFVFEPHRVTGHDDEWTLKQHVYTLERAIACSKSPDQTVNAVVNFGGGFSVRQHAPPTHIGQQFLTTLRNHYTGHVHRIFIVDAPLAFWCLWTLFQPFIGRKTKHKIHFVSSDAQKRRIIGELYDPPQAAPWMLPGGTKTREWDATEYLIDTPFDKAFDE